MHDIKPTSLDMSSDEKILALKHGAFIKSFKEADSIRQHFLVRVAIQYCELGLLRFIMSCMRLATKKITAKLGRRKQICDICYKSTVSTKKIRVAVVLNGGVGDLVNSAAFLTALYEVYNLPPADIFYPRVKNINYIFNNATFKNGLFSLYLFDDLAKNYDIIIRIQDFCKFTFRMSEQLLLEHGDLLEAVGKRREEYAYFDRYITYHPLLDGNYADEMIARGLSRITAPGLALNLHIDETKHYKIYPHLPDATYLQELGLDEPYITIHDGFEEAKPDVHASVRRSTKQWSLTAWEELVFLIKSEFPQFMIVQLGANNSRTIKGADKCLVGSTSLEQATLVLSKSRLHIDNESGLVRVAKAFGVQSVVLFGPTNPKYYGFKSNINIAPNVCGNCFWTTPDWMSKCPRGFDTPKCMDSILPEQVFHKIKNVLVHDIHETLYTPVISDAVN